MEQTGNEYRLSRCEEERGLVLGNLVVFDPKTQTNIATWFDKDSFQRYLESTYAINGHRMLLDIIGNVVDYCTKDDGHKRWWDKRFKEPKLMAKLLGIKEDEVARFCVDNALTMKKVNELAGWAYQKTEVEGDKDE